MKTHLQLLPRSSHTHAALHSDVPIGGSGGSGGIPQEAAKDILDMRHSITVRAIFMYAPLNNWSIFYGILKFKTLAGTFGLTTALTSLLCPLSPTELYAVTTKKYVPIMLCSKL